MDHVLAESVPNSDSVTHSLLAVVFARPILPSLDPNFTHTHVHPSSASRVHVTCRLLPESPLLLASD